MNFLGNCTMLMTFEKLVEVVLKKCDLDARQLEAESEIQSLLLEAVMG